MSVTTPTCTCQQSFVLPLSSPRTLALLPCDLGRTLGWVTEVPSEGPSTGIFSVGRSFPLHPTRAVPDLSLSRGGSPSSFGSVPVGLVSTTRRTSPSTGAIVDRARSPGRGRLDDASPNLVPRTRRPTPLNHPTSDPPALWSLSLRPGSVHTLLSASHFSVPRSLVGGGHPKTETVDSPNPNPVNTSFLVLCLSNPSSRDPTVPYPSPS